MVTARIPGLEERSAKLTEEEGGVDNSRRQAETQSKHDGLVIAYPSLPSSTFRVCFKFE